MYTATELIKKLQEEIDKYGDHPVCLWGLYGANTYDIEGIEFHEDEPYEAPAIHIYTDLMTG